MKTVKNEGSINQFNSKIRENADGKNLSLKIYIILKYLFQILRCNSQIFVFICV